MGDATSAFEERLSAALAALPLPAERRYAVAFSGGVDSTLLLAALVRLVPAGCLRALHVDHAIHPDSAAWERHCKAAAEGLGIAYRSERVEVKLGRGGGIEAPAREARYAALARMMSTGEVLLTAHHADDQLETLFLRLLRGAGVRGMRGIAAFDVFVPGYVARPLLGFARAELEAQARARGLGWLDDPSNADRRHDRNYLRAEVLPRLAARWPSAPLMDSRLAARMADAERVLEAMAEHDAAALDDRRRISRSMVLALPAERQRNLLRHLLRAAALPVPSARQLEEIRAALQVERADAESRVCWSGGEARFFRDRLYLLEPPPPVHALPEGAAVTATRPWSGADGVLTLVAGGSPGLPETWAREGLELGFRAGGERFHPAGSPRRRALKHWLREAGIVPWMRGRLPLLYHRGRLAAVADLWVSAEAAEARPDEPRYRVEWEGHPPVW